MPRGVISILCLLFFVASPSLHGDGIDSMFLRSEIVAVWSRNKSAVSRAYLESAFGGFGHLHPGEKGQVFFGTDRTANGAPTVIRP